MIIVDGTALRDAHRNRIARRERLLDRTIELLVQVRLRVLWKSLVSSGHDLTPVRTSEEVGHGRAAQLLNPTPGRKVNGPLLHSFQVAPDAPPLTHPENRYRAFVFSALVRSYLRPHRSSEERSPPRAANVCAISFACSSSGTRRMTSTRLSAIRAARFAVQALVRIVFKWSRGVTLRHGSHFSRSFRLNIFSVCLARSRREYSHQYPTTGP